mgnify:FL=1|tara:strand:+ start:2734 stop:3630 length:897 start_codon:yes stop_codon:yes gene_type:complete
MTEVVQMDSSEDSGSTEEEIDSGVIDLGADLESPSEAPPIEQISLTESTTGARATTEGAPDRPAGTGIDADLESIPEALRPMARDLKGDHTQKTQALANQRRENEALYQRLQVAELQNQQNGLSARVDAASPEADPFAEVRSRLGPDEQGALDIMREVVKTDVGQRVENQGQQVEQLTNAVRQLAMHVVGQVTSAQNTAAQDARQQYPDIDTYQAQINALTAVANPATSKTYTPTEAYELLTGIAGQKSAQLQAGQKKVRRTAASNASSSPSVSADSGSGALSETELAQKLAALGLTA